MFDIDAFDHDAVAQPLLQGAVHRHLDSGGEGVAVRGEDQLQQAATEIGPIDAFTGDSE